MRHFRPPFKQLATLIAVCCLSTMAAHADDTDLRKAINSDYPKLEALYQHFHKYPELSRQEFKTAKRLASELESLGYKVHKEIGITGLAAVYENGEGPTILIRADMDALPIKEASNLSFASTQTQVNLEGVEQPVMHACGHDMHITGLVGVAKQMMRLKDQWQGKLILVGQPDEEMIGGARLMVEDGLYDKVGMPDAALALHVISKYPAGKIVVNDNIMYSSADTVNIRVRGVGAHGASPHLGNDPIVIGSQIVGALQTIITREISPIKPALITVGTFHAGTAPNILAEYADLSLTVRANDEATRAKLIDSIERIATNTARAAGVSEDLLPVVERLGVGSPTTTNTPELVTIFRNAIIDGMGADAMASWYQSDMGAEDFPDMVNVNPVIPSVYFEVGGTSPERLAKGNVPDHHTPQFVIEHELAIKRGVEAMTLGALAMFRKF